MFDMSEVPAFMNPVLPEALPIAKPSRVTGVGRTRARGSYWNNKAPDLKKKVRRKMAKKSKRVNRR